MTVSLHLACLPRRVGESRHGTTVAHDREDFKLFLDEHHLLPAWCSVRYENWFSAIPRRQRLPPSFGGWPRRTVASVVTIEVSEDEVAFVLQGTSGRASLKLRPPDRVAVERMDLLEQKCALPRRLQDLLKDPFADARAALVELANVVGVSPSELVGARLALCQMTAMDIAECFGIAEEFIGLDYASIDRLAPQDRAGFMHLAG